MVNAGLNSVHDWLTTDKLTLDTKKENKNSNFSSNILDYETNKRVRFEQNNNDYNNNNNNNA